MLEQQTLIVIKNDEECEVEKILDIRTVYDTDPDKKFTIVDVLLKGAILPISIPFSELTLPTWERDADVLRMMLEVAEYEDDFARHPAAVAYEQEHKDWLADKQQEDELRGGL